MFKLITEMFHQKVEELSFTKTRHLYSSFDLRNQLTGLIGSRGVGKTTLLLQYIKNELMQDKKCFYFSANFLYFQQTTLRNLVKDLHVLEGYQMIFIDDIHKYANWDLELNTIADSFPALKIVFSGTFASHNLLKRPKLYRLHGMSFREYLNFSLDLSLQALPFQKLLQNSLEEMPSQLFSHFENYLKHGYYPSFFKEEKILEIIERTIFDDIANSYNLKTQNLCLFKKILAHFANSPLGEVNVHGLAKKLEVDNKTVEHYLYILVSAGLLRELYLCEEKEDAFRKPSRFVLNNTCLMYALQQYKEESVCKKSTRELFLVQALQNAGFELFYSKEGGYRTSQEIFEFNKKKKKRKLLTLPVYLVKDNILEPASGEFPLFLAGFLQ